MISRKTMAILAVSTMGVAAVSVTAIELGTASSNESAVEAATETTIYCAIHEDTLGSYTLKYNAQTSSSTWINGDMEDTGHTYNGYYRVYTATFTDEYDGLDQLQFQLYDGTTWIKQDAVFTSWNTATTYNGLMHIYEGSGWITYTYDGGTDTTVYYAVDSTSLSTYTPKINICYGTYDTDAWYQKDMTNTGKTYNGYLIYTVSFTDQNNGLGTLEFQLYNGTTQIYNTTVFSSTWNAASVYNGKMFVHGDTSLSWIDYLTDDGRQLVEGTFYALGYAWENFYFYIYQYHTATYYALGVWPGTAFSAVDGVTFNGHSVVKVTFEYYDNDSVTIVYHDNNNGSNHSGNLTYVENGYIYNDGTSWLIDSEDYSAACDLIVDIREAMGSATVDGETYDSSICAISNPSSYVTRYNALSTAAQGYFNEATINTYDPADLSATADVTGDQIIAQLSAMSSSSGSSFSLSNITENSGTMYILIAFLVIMVAGCVAIVVLRPNKRKSHQ